MNMSIKNFKIPLEFDKVVKKLYPEIEEINIVNVTFFQNWDTSPYPGDERYMINLHLVLNNNGYPQLKEIYAEMINQLFVFTYGDSDFVKFYVDDFSILKPQTKQQKFMDMFYVGG